MSGKNSRLVFGFRNLSHQVYEQLVKLEQSVITTSNIEFLN